MGAYICLDCGEKFQNRTQSVIHHLQTKHENYGLIGTRLKMIIKS